MGWRGGPLEGTYRPINGLERFKASDGRYKSKEVIPPLINH